MKTWKFVAIWAFILISGLLGLLLGRTMRIPIAEVVGGYLFWGSFFAGLGLVYRRSRRGGALAYNIALACAVSGFLLIIVGKIRIIQTVEGLGIGLFGLAALAGVYTELEKAWENVKVVDKQRLEV